MTMHPELKQALDTNLSVLEVIKLFAKQHSGVPEERNESYTKHETHNDCSFWDDWQPLFHKLYSPRVLEPLPVSQEFLSIHKNLTREVISWLCDSGRRSNIYLIEEAQTQTENVYENFRANAFASICYDAHRFGLPLSDAPCFDPSVSTICALLAGYYPPFRRILTKILFDKTEIHNLPTRTQFKKFIYEPWKALQISHPQYVAKPPVIVLRCYDRMPWIWYNKEDDEELLRSIYELASPPHALPLLWIISLSPKLKLHIQDLFDSFKCPRLTRLPTCYNDASTDTGLFLRHRFSILRQKHEISTDDEMWPSDEQMSHLIRIFLGTFDAIDVVTLFVDWEGNGGPKAHLATFLAYMVDSPSPSDEQPYCALDHFYTRALYAIPPELHSVVKRVLSFCYRDHYRYPMTSFVLACLLSVGQDIVFGVLCRLSRWAVILRGKGEVGRYDPSPFFREFLADAKRSRLFNVSKSEIATFLTYEVSLRIICHYSDPSDLLKPVGRFTLKAYGSEFKKLMENALWVFQHVPATGSHPEWALLRRFNFRCLAHSRITFHWTRLIGFVRMLYAWDKHNAPNIVRVVPAGRLDNEFIEKCEGIAEPLDLEEKGECWDLRPTGPKYVLLGLKAGTILVILAADRGPGDKLEYCGFSIYTSAMLDYM